MSKFKEIIREEKLQKMVKTQIVFALGQSTIEKQVSDNSHHFFILYFGGTLSLLIFAKISNKKCSKRLSLRTRGSKSKELAKKIV
jgi:hypothetical protein